MTSIALLIIDLQGKLPKLASGEVRDIYEVDEGTLFLCGLRVCIVRRARGSRGLKWNL